MVRGPKADFLKGNFKKAKALHSLVGGEKPPKRPDYFVL